jgi:hypothetical protein
MVSEHGYNTKPRWAKLVEVEARVSEGVVVKMDKTQVLPKVSPKVSSRSCVKRNQFWTSEAFLSAKRLPCSCYEAKEE